MLTDEDERAYRVFAQRAAYYARTGTSSCSVCNAVPDPQPVFSERMPCGHPWGVLAWTPRTATATHVEPEKR